ncbi:MAG: TIM-barrel domain-containing protein [Rikenellaceae bacterium]
MIRKTNLLFGLLSMAILSVNGQSKFALPMERHDCGVEVTSGDLKINVSVVDDGIIHVQKSPVVQGAYTSPDLVTVLEPQGVAWRLKETAEAITISTKELRVIVKSDATIEYADADGEPMVAELMKGSLADGKAVQSFTVGDEALYGLGQYQSGIFDWRCVPMTLRQYNQEVAVPFLVSTKGYGILWNNYSVTHFNPAEHEISFEEKKAEVSTLNYDATNIDVEDVKNAKAEADAKDNIRETTFTPDQSGLYTFYVKSDNGGRMRGQIKLTLDDDVVVDYATIWIPQNFSGRKYLEAGHEYKVVFRNTGARIPGQVFYNKPDYNKTSFSSEAATSIDYYLLAGASPADIVGLNHKLTGEAPLLSKKSYGFWQCRERYHNQAELLENANEMRKRKIPFDVIVQDWFYWPDKTKGPEWDRAKYTDPAAMAKEVHDLNLDIMVSVWPSVTNDPMLAKYDLVENSKLGKTPYMDFWDERVADGYYRMLSDSMFHMGINHIWLDGSEPGDNPGGGAATGMGEFRYLANSYSLMVTKAMYEGKREEYPRERVMNLTRSAFSGQQRYGAVTWSGDVQATWKQFGEQIAAGLNFTIAGVPYWSHDIGGFFRDSKSINPIFDSQYTNQDYIELLSRWFQFGAFSPVFRIHGYVSETEIWRYGAEFEALARKFIDLRYQLMPYIYSEARRVTTDGHVLMAPLVYYYPEDRECWSIDDQLFFGENIMAAFVTEPQQRQKEVYLPHGEWFDFWTNKRYEGGGSVRVAAALDSTPLFVKGGSIVPFGPKVQYATQPTSEPTHIRVYTGADAAYTLYFDDNISYDYEEGVYSEVKFAYNHKSGTLEIAAGQDKYVDFANNPMSFVVDVMGSDKSYDVTFVGKKLKVKL